MTATTARAAPWRSRITGHAEVAPADFVPNPRNWRTHPAEQQRALSGALSEVGWVADVLVNRTTGHVVDGHLRIELALDRSLENSSRDGEVVYGPFLGSGTTLVAAEQIGRRGCAMELDPRYAQVAIERWEAFRGRSAERLDG